MTIDLDRLAQAWGQSIASGLQVMADALDKLKDPRSGDA